jgi:UPF0716 protein FxsA
MRRRWPLLIVLVLLVAVPIFEVWLLLVVGHHIGLLPTVAILVVEAALGGWLMRREGRRAWDGLAGAFQSGRMPTGELADAALILVGGVLLMLPGFATDVIGLVFLVPFTRSHARRLLAFLVARRLGSRLNVDLVRSARNPGDVIEGEVVGPPSAGRSNGAPVVLNGEIEEGEPR